MAHETPEAEPTVPDSLRGSLLAKLVRPLGRGEHTFALRVALVYLLAGSLWIEVSDRVLATLVDDPARLTAYQTYKGWAFVLATSILLYLIVWASLRVRRKIKRKQAESERFLSTLIGNLPGVVYECANHTDWTMKYLSPGVTELTGYQPHELIGNERVAWGELIHPDDRDRVWERVQDAVARRRSFQLEYRILTRDGRQRWVWEQGTPTFSADGELLDLEGFITDITGRRKAEERVRRQVEHLRALRAIDMAITGSLDLRVTLNVILDQVTARLEVDATDILLLDRGSGRLEYAAGRGFLTDALKHTRLRLGEGGAGRAAQERRMVHVPDLRQEPGDLVRSVLVPEERFVSYFAVPLVAKGDVKGVLELFGRSPLSPDPAWTELLEALAGQTAIAIDNAGLFDELERANLELARAYDETIEGWARALDLRDDETEGHSRRVTALTVRMAREMGVSDEELVHVRRGALLHDIGKMGIPDRILNKPGPLTEEEWEVMKRHPVYAYELLAPIPFLRRALDIPYCHHEKWDGTGYPRGLEGELVPLEARIFAVADVWDALRSDRPYRDAWSEDEALRYIREQSGKHFDPAVVEVFLGMETDEPGSREDDVGTRVEIVPGA